MTGRHWSGAVAHRIGLSGEINFTATRVGQTLHLPCKNGHIVDFRITGNMPPDFVAKKLMQRGWTIGSGLKCPKCSGQKVKKPQEKSLSQITSGVTSQPIAPAPPKVDASEAARQARRDALQWLAESFSVETGRYSEGVSDASIARETKLAENAIIGLREEFYGPLKEPSEVEELRKALKEMRDTLTTNVDNMRQQIRTLELRLDRIAEKFSK